MRWFCPPRRHHDAKKLWREPRSEEDGDQYGDDDRGRWPTAYSIGRAYPSTTRTRSWKRGSGWPRDTTPGNATTTPVSFCPAIWPTDNIREDSIARKSWQTYGSMGMNEIRREADTIVQTAKWRLSGPRLIGSYDLDEDALLTLGNNIHERQVSGGRLAARYDLDRARSRQETVWPKYPHSEVFSSRVFGIRYKMQHQPAQRSSAVAGRNVSPALARASPRAPAGNFALPAASVRTVVAPIRTSAPFTGRTSPDTSAVTVAT